MKANFKEIRKNRIYSEEFKKEIDDAIDGKTVTDGNFMTQFINKAPGHSIQDYQGAMILYNGDSIRSKGTLVEYTARPQASGTSKGVISAEDIGSPMSLRYSPEREVRLPEGVKVKDMGIKNIHLLPPLNPSGRQSLIDKYSPLGKVIFHENSWEFKKVLK